MLLKGFELMIVGMSVVFLFLILLVITLKSTSFLVGKLNLRLPDEQLAGGDVLKKGSEIAAALAAIKAFSKNR
ncbi:MAG: OadG family protein [Candidatus Hermodarchaeota archaeon]|nr:OadG family protein [Candidatus Hermodarchaeota archaeon]